MGRVSSAIDGLSTLIRGQKLPIFSGNGLPYDKLAVLELRARQGWRADEFAVVFAAMGVKTNVAAYFKRARLRRARRTRQGCDVLNCPGDPVVERIITPRAALTVAEYLAFTPGCTHFGYSNRYDLIRRRHWQRDFLVEGRNPEPEGLPLVFVQRLGVDV